MAPWTKSSRSARAWAALARLVAGGPSLQEGPRLLDSIELLQRDALFVPAPPAPAPAPAPVVLPFPFSLQGKLATLERSFVKDGQPPKLAGLEMAEMMTLMQEFVDYIKDDNFMRSFVILANEYQAEGSKFQREAHRLVDKFLNASRGANESVFMPLVGKFFDNVFSVIRHFVDDMAGKMSSFIQSMPMGLMRQRGGGLLPELDNVTVLIGAHKKDKFERKYRGLQALGFCSKVEPLLHNASMATSELTKLTKVVNESQRTIPMIGRFINQMISKDDPDSADVAPRVMMLEGQILDTAFSIFHSLREVTNLYKEKVGKRIVETMHCAVDAAMGLLPHGGLAVVFAVLLLHAVQ